MSMGLPGLVGLGLAVVNTLLLAGVGVVWLRNYRQFRSSMLLGLVGFSTVLFLENALAGYLFVTGMKTVWSTDQTIAYVLLTMRLLEFVAIGLLARATLN